MNEIVLTSQNFDREVLQADLPVLVDFYAEWCGSCRMLSSVLASISEKYAGKIKVGMVDVDKQPELAARWNINALPAVIAFRSGKRIGASVGLKDERQILAMLE